MALCSVCATVPFLSLPSPLSQNGSIRIADKEELPELWYTDTEQVPKNSALGFPWHEHIDALAASAKICPLCELVQNGVQSWLDLYKDVSTNSKHFAEFHKNDSSVPSGKQLWLTKRFGGGPGFLVLVRNPKNAKRVYLLTGVSFAVEAGAYS
jgi:hypothetical protein